MDTFTLPPSPNWQLSNILACNDNGLLAYGFRGEISLVDLKSDGNFSVSFLNLAHKEKISCLVFSPVEGKFSHCLASCGDDGMVRVWDYKKLRLLYCHSGHKDGVRVMGLDWSHADNNRVVSVNDLGIIVCWDLASNTIRRLHCGTRVLPLCLACCPHDKELVAIGCKGGATLVVDIKGSGKLIHRLRGIEQDVISVSWCPVPYNVIRHKKNEDPKEGDGERDRELLLATGGLDKNIFIWRAGSDGRFEIVLNLTTTGLSKNNQRKKGFQGMSAPMLWICVRWVDGYTLLSSSTVAELLVWDLNKISRDKKPQPRVLHSRHNKGCFSIACPVVYNKVSDWKEERVVWTTAMDKHIVATSLATGSVLKDITTLGGMVCCMALSPMDPNRLAIGSSDSKVFVWNTSDMSSLNLASYWKKIIGRVMAVCWHPSEEDLLAYGTSDGYVGLLELGSNKPPTLLRLHMRKAVYRVCWAPPLLKPDNETIDSSKLVLYAVGDGDVFQFNANPQKPEEEPKSMNNAVLNSFDKSLGLQKALGRCDIAFKPDLTCFAVASENGSVYIVSRDSLALQHSLYPHKKLINSTVWHPATVACDNSVSPQQHWLATACDNVRVYNIPPDGEPELVASLNGHSEKVVSLDWSPHFHGRLLSASYDSTVQVWDVPNQACLAICPVQHVVVMCALFSSQDPDVVVSGSTDCTVRFFSISKMSTPSAKPEKKKHRVGVALKMRSEVEEATELTVCMFDISQNEDEKASKRNVSPNTSVQSAGSVKALMGLEKGLNEKKKQRVQNMFPVTGRQLTQAPHFEVMLQRWLGNSAPTPLCAEETPAPTAADLGYLDFFGDEKAMQRLLLVEEGHNIQNKSFLLAQQSALWRGDVTQMIREAITKKQLSDWLISIAPLAGYDLWEQACGVYADQLTECGEVSKAAMYLLATHKSNEAVQLLVDYSLYSEAVAVAKCRLAPDDPLITYAYTRWGEWAQHQGQSTLAAHCFLAAGDTQACVETLSRVKELRWLRVAAQLAGHAGQAELANSLALDCLSLSITIGNLPVARQLLAGMPQYQYWSVWLRASELLAKVKNRSEREVFAWLEGQQEGLFNLFDELNTACVSAGPVYHQLLPHLPTNKTPEFERDMWGYMSGQLAAACAARLEATPAQFLRHTVCALSAAFHFQTGHPTSLALPLALTLLAPKGLFAEGSIFQIECKTPEEKLLLKSVRAFACASVVLWMKDNWEQVTDLLKKGEPTECDSGDSKENEELRMAWVPYLVESCSVDVLDPENTSFYIKKAQKEQLQNLVNKENIQNKFTASKVENDNKKKNRWGKRKTLTNKTDNSLEESKAKEKVSDDNSTLDGSRKSEDKFSAANENNNKLESINNVSKTNSGQLEKEEIVTSKSDTSEITIKEQKTLDKINSSGCEIEKTKSSEESDNTETLPSEINKPTIIVNESIVESPKSLESSSNGSETTKNLDTNTDIATSKTAENNQSSKPDGTISLSHEPSITNGMTRNGSDVEQTSNEDPNSKLDQIKDLDDVLMKFERARESVPNPFTAYINIKHLLDNLVAKQDAKLAQQLQENCDTLWKRSQQ